MGQKMAEFQVPFTGGMQEDQMEVYLGDSHRGMEEIQIHMGNNVRGGIRLYGVELIPLETENPKMSGVMERERDQTDTGNAME